MTDEQRQIFLERFGQTGDLTGSARAAGIDRDSLLAARRTDENFYYACFGAERQAAEYLLYQARRRALDGIEHPQLERGRPVRNADGSIATERVFNDTLLMFLIEFTY